MQKCRTCKQEKPLEQFGINRAIKSGINTMCKACAAAAAKAYRVANPDYWKKDKTVKQRTAKWAAANRDKISAYGKKWYRENKDHVRRYEKSEHIQEYRKRYRAENKEQIAQRTARWAAENQDRCAARTARYRAKRLQATPAWAEQFIINEAYELAMLRTAATGVPHSVDHIVPLQGENVSGLHVHENLRVIPAAENSSKKNRFEVGA